MDTWKLITDARGFLPNWNPPPLNTFYALTWVFEHSVGQLHLLGGAQLGSAEPTPAFSGSSPRSWRAHSAPNFGPQETAFWCWTAPAQSQTPQAFLSTLQAHSLAYATHGCVVHLGKEERLTFDKPSLCFSRDHAGHDLLHVGPRFSLESKMYREDLSLWEALERHCQLVAKYKTS